MNDEVKVCTQCSEAKPLDAFGSDKSRPDGKYSMCKACKNARNDPAKKKRYYEANKETLLAKQKLRNADPVRKEQKREYYKAYYQKNIDKRKAYIEANREKIVMLGGALFALGWESDAGVGIGTLIGDRDSLARKSKIWLISAQNRFMFFDRN